MPGFKFQRSLVPADSLIDFALDVEGVAQVAAKLGDLGAESLGQPKALDRLVEPFQLPIGAAEVAQRIDTVGLDLESALVGSRSLVELLLV
jgi:hypothetical protein